MILKDCRLSLFFCMLCMLSFSVNAQQKAQHVMLPNGWGLSPAGIQFPLGDLPLNIAVSPNEKWLAVTNNGYGRQCVQLFDVKHQKMTADVTMKMSWYGLCFSPDSKRLYASGGNENMIHVFSVSSKGEICQVDSIIMGKPWPEKISPSGMAICKRKNQLFVVTRHNNSLYIYNLRDNKLVKTDNIGGEAYDIVFSKDEKKAYISNWSTKEVKVWDVNNMRWDKPIGVGTHPNELCLDRNGKRLFVANAEDNTVSVINLAENRVEETLNTAPYESKLEGSTTNGLAVTPNNKTLVIANADNNCLTLFDISKSGQSRSTGFIPTGWYPTNVKCIGDKFWVTNGKGLCSKPNPEGPHPTSRTENYGHHKGDRNKKKGVQYIAGLFLGALSIIDAPDETELAKYTRQVFENTPYQGTKKLVAEGEKGNPIPTKVGEKSPIKHVFYIIKENRTYDQVLGDMKEGNGDSSLCLFGERITPNLHKIAREFVLLDNFYVNAEVSCDGHNWTMGAYANDYLEKIWPSVYSGRGGYYPAEGHYYMGNNKGGFLWKACKNAGVSFRTYGEFATRRKNKIVPNVEELKGHVCQTFEPWDLQQRDTMRVKQWIRDFDKLVISGSLPQFCTVRLGGDHTEGMRLGKMTPYAHVADNDMAVGQFVEHLSKSPVWKESVVFVVEDDAQNGSDHVDAHRSTAYLAGGYVKRYYVDHTPYTTTSMLRTMELILGVPPMTQYDASARSMWRSFNKVPDMKPFQSVASNINLNDKNTKSSRWQAMSENFNFKKEDDVPDMEFNKVLWFGLKGDAITYPPLHRSAFLSYKIEDNDD